MWRLRAPLVAPPHRLEARGLAERISGQQLGLGIP
jgi:hypothetical protein